MCVWEMGKYAKGNADKNGGGSGYRHFEISLQFLWKKFGLLKTGCKGDKSICHHLLGGGAKQVL